MHQEMSKTALNALIYLRFNWVKIMFGVLNKLHFFSIKKGFCNEILSFPFALVFLQLQ
jgi:hypothetical protein